MEGIRVQPARAVADDPGPMFVGAVEHEVHHLADAEVPHLLGGHMEAREERLEVRDLEERLQAFTACPTSIRRRTTVQAKGEWTRVQDTSWAARSLSTLAFFVARLRPVGLRLRDHLLLEGGLLAPEDRGLLLVGSRQDLRPVLGLERGGRV